MQQTPFDNTQASFRALNRALPLICAAGIAAAGLGYGIARKIPPSYEVHFSYIVALQERDTSPGFRYDGYYALSGTELFSSTLASLIASPEMIVQAYQEAKLPVSTQDPFALTKRVRAQKAASQLVQKTISDMHIAIDVRSLMEGRHSGVEEYTTRMIDAMSRVRSKHQYHLFYNAAKPVQLPLFRKNVSVHAFRHPNKLFNTSQLLFRFPKWDRIIPVPIDVFFVPNPRLIPLTHGKPFVTVAHDISYERFPEFLTWKRKLWHIAMQPKSLLARSS